MIFTLSFLSIISCVLASDANDTRKLEETKLMEVDSSQEKTELESVPSVDEPSDEDDLTDDVDNSFDDPLSDEEDDSVEARQLRTKTREARSKTRVMNTHMMNKKFHKMHKKDKREREKNVRDHILYALYNHSDMKDKAAQKKLKTFVNCLFSTDGDLVFRTELVMAPKLRSKEARSKTRALKVHKKFLSDRRELIFFALYQKCDINDKAAQIKLLRFGVSLWVDDIDLVSRAKKFRMLKNVEEADSLQKDSVIADDEKMQPALII